MNHFTSWKSVKKINTEWDTTWTIIIQFCVRFHDGKNIDIVQSLKWTKCLDWTISFSDVNWTLDDSFNRRKNTSKKARYCQTRHGLWISNFKSFITTEIILLMYSPGNGQNVRSALNSVIKMDRSSKGSQTCFMMTLYANEETKKVAKDIFQFIKISWVDMSY